MPAVIRRKACIACAASKRRCDKQLPDCQRCLDRDEDCLYPQSKRRLRDRVPPDNQLEELPALQEYADLSALENSLDLGYWGEMETANLDASLSDVEVPCVPALPASFTGQSAQRLEFESGDTFSLPCPWFLQDETWIKQHSNQDFACEADVELESFVLAVEGMLKSWVRDGHNCFIHRRLYEKGMPTNLQDAFTTLAAYFGRTPAVKETILQIAEERSIALAHQSQPTTGGAQGILAHLARVQAFFIYEFIRLFDGSIRRRASAEQQLPTLRHWVFQMWQAVKQYRGEDGFLGHRPLHWTANDFDREFNTSSDLWKLWILTESVRRTHVIVDTIANVYQTMTKGWAECDGAVNFTARRGLWEAESAMRWVELSCAKPPLLVPSLQPSPLISQYAAEEFDDFVQLFWRFILGTDKIQSWIDRSVEANRV